MSPWRTALLCIVCIQQVYGNKKDITGYLGQSVVLKSGVDSSWTLTKVQWSIYKNTTYIASLKDGAVTIYNFWTHQGRLELNTKTGDLTIKNLSMDDDMTYTVALVNSDDTRVKVQVRLTVQEQLKEPNIQKILDSLKDGRCHVALSCTAFHQNVNLSWTPDGKFNGFYVSGNTPDSMMILFTSFSGKRNVTFNCTASNGQQTATKQMTVGCSEEKQKSKDSTICSLCSCVSSVIWTIVVTAVVLALAYAFTQRERIKKALPDNLRLFIQNLRGTSRDSRADEDQMGHNTKTEKASIA